MGKINRLPPGLANQIAAGEVVERPASAVKELVENALDAGAVRVAVTLELGGKRLIRVEDDGEGMIPADAALAVERHATSKVGNLEDLAAIATLGFRGEALPSIGSVSHLRLRTRVRGASSGVEVAVDGGEPARATVAGLPVGTTVEVRDLFYNVPARRKFLKSDGAEAGHISRALTQLALAYHGVGFRLRSGARTLFDHPPVASFADRFFQVYGDRSGLVEVRKEAAGMRLSGLVAALAADGPARGPQHLFVNRRAVKDRTILHAVNEAYSGATIKPRSPEVHLFLEIPHDRIDVNVHPTKAEVRFLEQSLVHKVVSRALADALGQEAVPQVSLSAPPGRAPAEPRTHAIPGIVAGMGAASRWGAVTEVFRRREGDGGRAGAVRERPAGDEGVPVPPPSTEAGGSVAWDLMRPEGAAGAVQDSAATPGATVASGVGPAPLIPLGQFRDTFIIAVDNDGVVIIDQHVAHERILYEQVTERLTRGSLESQRLLEPLLIALPPGARDALAAHAEDLARLGFEVESFGGDSVRVAAVPALLGRGECESAVRDLAEDLEGLDHGAVVGDAIGRIAASTACHAAVKANDRLTLEKMSYILQELRRTAYSTVCPHGRPVLLRLTRQELEKRFERI
jgi:DNA mismatch repair protein MutL